MDGGVLNAAVLVLSAVAHEHALEFDIWFTAEDGVAISVESLELLVALEFERRAVLEEIIARVETRPTAENGETGLLVQSLAVLSAGIRNEILHVHGAFPVHVLVGGRLGIVGRPSIGTTYIEADFVVEEIVGMRTDADHG